MGYTSYSTINTLDEFSIIGGNDLTFIFEITDENGADVDLTSASGVLKIAPYGQPTATVVSISGAITLPNTISFILPAATSELMIGGKYMYQPIITDSLAKIYRPNQGTFVLIQSIGVSTDAIDVPRSAFYVSATGTDSYSAVNAQITSYYEGLSIILNVENTNTGASTLTITGVVGAIDIKKVDISGTIVALIAGDLIENNQYVLTHDGTCWILVGYKDSGVAVNLLLSLSPANGTSSGISVSATVDTNAEGFGAPLTLAADGHWDTSDANASGKYPCQALALQTGTGTKSILLYGPITNTAWNWTMGAGVANNIYLSTTIGTLTQTAPSATDDVIQIIGFALSPDTIMFSPQLNYITHV